MRIGLLKNKEYKTILSNYSSLVFLQAANYILPLVTIPFLVRVLGAERFGLIMFAQALCTFLNVIVEYGFNLSATRQISILRGKKRRTAQIFSAVYCCKLILLILAFTILAAIVFFIDRFAVDRDVYLLSFGFIIGQALFPEWFFLGIQKMRFVTIAHVIAKLIFTLLIFLVIREREDYILVPLFNAIGFIVAGLLSLFVALRYTYFLAPRRILIHKLFKESSSLFVSNLATRLFNSANVFVLGLFAGNTLAGVYSSIEKLIVALKSFFLPLYQAIFPWLSKQSKKIQFVVTKKLGWVILAGSLCLMLPVLFFATFILDFVYDDMEIVSYALVFKITSLAIVFSAMNMITVTLFFPAFGNYKLRMNILIAGGVLNLVLLILLTPLYGVYGTAIAVVITEFVIMALGWYHFRRIEKTYSNAN